MEKKHVSRAEEEANDKAIKQVANMLQRPDQLDKVEQCKRRVARKKASVEARLKAAVQSQLDGVKTGLSQMTEALNEVREIKENMISVDEMYSNCGALSDKMRDIKDISAQHRQLAAAMENLKHLFGVPEEVAKARDLMKDDKLLLAHKSLTDLETSRDDLLSEQYKLENHSGADIKQLQTYFKEAEKLSDELGQVLRKSLSKTITLVRKDSSSLVTALRIVEREHRTDMKMLEQEKFSGFLPPGRPKRWREKTMETLKQAVEDRVESDFYDTREADKMWLVRHLEILRKNVLEDLRVVKFLCVPCFPPAYNIFQQYAHWYHLALASHVAKLIKEGLEGNEIISLLTWLNHYTGRDLMGHFELGLDTNRLPPLLDDNVSEELMHSYFTTTKQNMLSWTQKSLQQDAADWRREASEPETDVDGYYRTSLPVILFQMIQQTIQVAETISDTLKKRVFQVCIEEMNKFVRSYAEAITSYKDEHFQNREFPPFYPLYMVAAVNNCEAFTRFAVNLQLAMEKGMKGGIDSSEIELLQMDQDDSEIDGNPFLEGENVDPLLQFRHEMDNVAQAACGFLLDEVFMDLQPHCSSLFQKAWLNDRSAVDTICVTVEDYYTDYVHLRPKYLDWIMREAEKRVIVEYLRAILGRRMKLNNASERLQAGEKLLQEQQMLSSLFNKLSPSSVRSACEALIPIAEVIKLQDKSMMSLELSGLVSKYHDASAEQMQALLAIRGDFSASEGREMVIEAQEAIESSKTITRRSGLYELVEVDPPPIQIPVPSSSSLFSKFNI
ncbi:exocyst complex component 3-like isoform X1 [Clavelina lepadiformis]|uniref:exocyst complex component 3-like isoform X1 n=1 Tax=Clavelina lepadiformis TaxID=159417 RepID=UPI0040431A3C